MIGVSRRTRGNEETWEWEKLNKTYFACVRLLGFLDSGLVVCGLEIRSVTCPQEKQGKNWISALTSLAVTWIGTSGTGPVWSP